MPAQDLISIVVPVYNTENYLPRCIRSLQQQSYQNLETGPRIILWISAHRQPSPIPGLRCFTSKTAVSPAPGTQAWTP